MATKLSNLAVNAEADALCVLANDGYLRIYDGAQPANADTAVGAQVLLAELRFGNPAFGAAALGAGTKTLEGVSLRSIVAAGPITASLNGTIIPPGTLFWETEVGDGGCPLILVQNEGFVIRSVAVPATGTWRMSVMVDWAEVAAY